MIPRVTTGGGSFNGAFLYYMRDKGSDTRERVAWARAENVNTDCPDKAWRVMAYTAKAQARLKEASEQARTGRKLEKPVFAFSLSWRPEQSPSPDHMLDTARKAINMLGLGDHQAVMVAHDDEPQPHVHVIVNRVHPLTGLAGDIRNSKRKFSDFAREYERAHGKIYCARREENYQKRTMKQTTRYSDPYLQEVWDTADSGRAFVAALEEKGYRLAQGYKRIVIVDPRGKVHNPTRLLKDVRAAAFTQRLAEVDLSLLPDANEVAATVRGAQTEKDKAPQARKRDATRWRARPASAEEARQEPAQPEPEKQDDEPAPRALDEERQEPQPETERAPEPDPTPHGQRDQSAFEELAALQTIALRGRQEDERARLDDQLRRRLVAIKKRLIAYHELPEKRASILRLRDKIETAPWWQRLLGVTAGARRQKDNEVLIYREAVRRYRESVAAAEKKGRETWDEFDGRQADERARLGAHIEQLRERNGLFRGAEERALARGAGPLREGQPEGPVRGL